MSNISTQEIKEFRQQKVYCIQLSVVTRKLALELTGNEFKLYFILQDLVNFDKDFNGEFSISFLAAKTNMGRSTLKRCLAGLENKNFLKIERSRKADSYENNRNNYQVTLPSSWRKDIENATNRARKEEEGVQNGPTRGSKMDQTSVQNEPHYRNNNINIKTEIQEENCSVVFDQKISELHERLEKSKKSKSKLNKLIAQSVKQNDFSSSKKYNEEYCRLDVAISRLNAQLDLAKNKNRVREEVDARLRGHDGKQSGDGKQKKSVSPGTKAYIEKQLAEYQHVTNPPEVCEQIIFAIENGQLRGSNDLHSANAALKMVRKDVWRTPYLN